MTSLGRHFGLALVVLLSAQVDASAASQTPSAPAPKHPASVVHAPVPAPQYIRDRVKALGQAFNGRVGIAVRSVDEGWSAGWKADEYYPQQSVSKLWVSI